jgi:hypothetical protein
VHIKNGLGYSGPCGVSCASCSSDKLNVDVNPM